MEWLIDENDIKVLLLGKQKSFRKREGLTAVIAATSYIASVACSHYPDFIIPGKCLKISFLVLSVITLCMEVYSYVKNWKYSYGYEEMIKDIKDLNKIQRQHSLVAIKDRYNQFPNRFLLYHDNEWNCDLFPNFKTRAEDNEKSIVNNISNALKIRPENIKLIYKGNQVHQKFSYSAKEIRVYRHDLYEADIEEFPEKAKENTFEYDGRRYRWMSIAEMEKDETIMKKNSEVVHFVKDNM